MNKFLCQMIGYDGEDDWTEIKALDAQDAASTYAEQCESRSGGDMLNREDQDEETVLVKTTYDATSVLRFVVTVSYHKHFWARIPSAA